MTGMTTAPAEITHMHPAKGVLAEQIGEINRLFGCTPHPDRSLFAHTLNSDPYCADLSYESFLPLNSHAEDFEVKAALGAISRVIVLESISALDEVVIDTEVYPTRLYALREETRRKLMTHSKDVKDQVLAPIAQGGYTLEYMRCERFYDQAIGALDESLLHQFAMAEGLLPKELYDSGREIQDALYRLCFLNKPAVQTLEFMLEAYCNPYSREQDYFIIVPQGQELMIAAKNFLDKRSKVGDLKASWEEVIGDGVDDHFERWHRCLQEHSRNSAYKDIFGCPAALGKFLVPWNSAVYKMIFTDIE